MKERTAFKVIFEEKTEQQNGYQDQDENNAFRPESLEGFYGYTQTERDFLLNQHSRYFPQPSRGCEPYGPTEKDDFNFFL